MRARIRGWLNHGNPLWLALLGFLLLLIAVYISAPADSNAKLNAELKAELEELKVKIQHLEAKEHNETRERRPER